MGIPLTDVPKLLEKGLSIRREDIARAKQFTLRQSISSVLGMAEGWVKEQKLEPVTQLNYMTDDCPEILERVARGYSLYMAFFQAVWELGNSGEIVPLSAPEVWKPHLGYRTPHGSGGIQISVSYPYIPQIHRVVMADGVSTDPDIFLQGVNCTSLHPGIREAIDQALGCFRRGLYMPATAMLAAAAEATWTECGVKVAAKIGSAKLDGIVSDPYASISKKVTETRKALEQPDGKLLLKAADRTIADVNNTELWTTALRERRNALHWDKAKSFVADHGETASLLMAAPMHIGTLESVRAVC